MEYMDFLRQNRARTVLASGPAWNAIARPGSILMEPQGGQFVAFERTKDCFSFLTLSPASNTWSLHSPYHQAYDFRNKANASSVVTEDDIRGALRRFHPDPEYLNRTWDILHGPGTRDYFRIMPGTNWFEWTASVEEGRLSAEIYFPNAEGTSQRDGTLYFVSWIRENFRSERTSEETMIGDGRFGQEPDALVSLTDNILYFTDDGGDTPGVYGGRFHRRVFLCHGGY